MLSKNKITFQNYKTRKKSRTKVSQAKLHPFKTSNNRTTDHKLHSKMIESIKNIKGFSLSNIKVYYKNKVIKTVYIGKDRPKDY